MGLPSIGGVKRQSTRRWERTKKINYIRSSKKKQKEKSVSVLCSCSEHWLSLLIKEDTIVDL